MRSLVQFLEDAIAADPGNTMGAGNPAMPGMNGEIGSGDTLVRDGDIKIKNRKRKKKRKKHHNNDDEERISRRSEELL